MSMVGHSPFKDLLRPSHNHPDYGPYPQYQTWNSTSANSWEDDNSLEGRLYRLATEARRRGLTQKQATEAIRKAIGEAALDDKDDDWICGRASGLMEQALEGSRNVIRYYEEMDAAEMEPEAFLTGHHPPRDAFFEWDDVFGWVSKDRRPALSRTIQKVLDGEIAMVRIEEDGMVRNDDLVEVVAHVLLGRPVRFRVDPELRVDPEPVAEPVADSKDGRNNPSIRSGPLSDRPPPGCQGAVYSATDVGKIYVDEGSGWTEIEATAGWPQSQEGIQIQVHLQENNLDHFDPRIAQAARRSLVDQRRWRGPA